MVMVALHHIVSINGQPHRHCRKYSDRELLVVYRPLVSARGTARNNCGVFRENPEIAVTEPKTSVVKKRESEAFRNTTQQYYCCEVSHLSVPHLHAAPSSQPAPGPVQVQHVLSLYVFSAYQRVLEDLLGARGGDV